MELGRMLREAVRDGDFDAVAPSIAQDAVLDSSSERGRRRVEGRAAIAEHMAAAGPGEVLDWDTREWPSGAAVTFEWRGASGVDRRRWYLRRSDGEITGWWSYAARPRAGDDTPASMPERVLGQVGAGAQRAPLAHGGNSGAALERVLLPDGTVLIAKRVGRGADWLGRVTGDRGRTALLWRAGAFARMPAAIDHGIESVVDDGDAWWVVMRDLSRSFLGDERRLSRAESRHILDAAAAMHRAFTDAVPDGAATLRDRLGMSSPRVAQAERAGPDLLPKQLDAAWDAFAEAVPADVADEVLAAAWAPSALAAALEAAGPHTLLHGDLRDDNLGLTGDRIVLLDWDLATAGTPTVEFAWYLCHDAWRIDAGHDELEADYRAAEGDHLSEREAELGMLTGLVQYGWIFGHSLRVHPDPWEQTWARAELDWWVPRTRSALEHVGGMPRG
jgi:aminoglycoside phosphotransferase (APT) family kinase protein